MAGGRVRGITIELSGDASGLVKSLKDTNKATKDVQKELKDINKVLKFDPSSTELLSQKQKALKEAVSATEEQLKAEKAALAELQNSPDADKTVKQQEALKRQITETEAKLKDAKQELKEFGSVGAQQIANVGEKFKELGGKVTEVGEALTKKVTGPLVAAGAASVASFKSVDSGLDTIVKKTGVTGAELEDMEAIFNNIGSRVPASFEEIGSAIGEVNTRFGITGEGLEDLSEQFIKFAQINGQDVTTAVDQTQKALSAYGKGAESAGEYLDVMNRVAQLTGVSVDKLQSGIVSNATAFQELGLTLEQSTLLMGNLEKSGANSETVLNGMRKALKNAAAEGKPLNVALEELQDTIENGTDNMDGLTAAYDLFGKSGDQIYGAVKQGTINFRDLAATVDDAGGSIATTYEEILDPTDEAKIAFQQLQIAGAKLGKTLLGTLAPAITKVREFVEKLTAKWQGLSPQMQQTIVKVGLVVAAVGPLLVVIGKVISVVGTIMSIVPKLSAAITALSGPVGIAIAAFAALVAAGVAIYKNWDVIKQKAVEIWTAIKTFFANTIEAIKTKFQVFGVIKDYVVARFQALKTAVSTIIQWIKDYIQGRINLIKAAFNAFGQIYTYVSGKITAVKDKIASVLETARATVSNKISSIKAFFSNGFSGIASTVSGVFNRVKEAITGPIEKARQTISNIISRIKNLFPPHIGKIIDIKLPHFSVSGGTFPYGFMGKGKFPSVSVEWYKKAMQNGMILDRPTIFGYSNGRLLAGGEAGSETIVGTSSLMGMIQSATRQNTLDPAMIYEAVRQGASDATIKAYLSGRDVTDSVSRELTKIQSYNARFQGA